MTEQDNALERESLSILLPILNGARFIGSMRQHLSKIALPSDELILIDDGSNDETWNLITAWANEDDRLIAIQNPNKGLANALNLGIKVATKDWIARFDIDDKYEMNRLNLQMSMSNPNVGVIFSDYDYISSSGKNLGVIPSPIDKDATAISLISSRRTAHPSAVINRLAVQSVGGYLQEDFPAEDLSLWLRMSRVSDLVTYPATLLHYQMSASSVTSTRRRQMLQTKQRLLNDIGVNSQSVLNANTRAEEILDTYLDYSMVGERQLHFFIDLFNAQRKLDFSLAFAGQIHLNQLMRGLHSSIYKTFRRRYLN